MAQFRHPTHSNLMRNVGQKKKNKTKTARNATVPSLPGDAHWHTNSTERRWHVKYFYIHLSVTRRTGHRVDMASRTSPTSPSSAQIFGNRRGISFLFFFFYSFQTKYNPRSDHSSSDKWESTPVPSRFK